MVFTIHGLVIKGLRCGARVHGALLRPALVATFTAASCGAQPLEFTRMLAHWAEYSDPGYLPFVDEVKPEIVQVGFYGAHFWSLADTPFGGGYPAHFPVRGHRECSDWFRRLNAELHNRGVKIVGHMNVKFLVGDPQSPEGPRGFFRFYRDQWDEGQLGPRPAADPLELLEVDKQGQPLSDQSYSIGGMREYWACLNNPHWRDVLKAWVRYAVSQGVDGLVANYFYRHDCHCQHCVRDFRAYLGERFAAPKLKDQFGITDLQTHAFDEIGAWHDPAETTPLRLEALRFSQIANKRAFDEVFVEYGRSLKPDLIVAQWNHLGDFSQISGDERCLLPGELWGRDEDYLWYSTGGVTNATDLAEGVLGEATLQMRYIRGAFKDKPFTLGRYESVRLRSAIAELAANGGAPMGFYTPFKDAQARREIVRYYSFLRRHENLYRANRPHAEALLLFPRRSVHAGDVEVVARFKKAGRTLLDEHVLFNVRPDDEVTAAERAEYAVVINPADLRAGEAAIQERLPAERSQFDAARTIRVSASRPRDRHELTLHFVNYNRDEPADKQAAGRGIQDEKPIATEPFKASVLLPDGARVERIEFLAPEADASRLLRFDQTGRRVALHVPAMLVYGVVRVRLAGFHPHPPAPSPVQGEGEKQWRDSFIQGEMQVEVAETRKIAALVSEYRHNSHADVIVGRLLQTDTLDGNGRKLPLELVSLYVDQRPGNDMSRELAAAHGFRLSPTIADALTLGTGQLAVDGVLLVAEHGDYPKSPTGNTQYPKRRFWEETLQVFRESGCVVPVFIDKHLADNWTDARWIYDTARELDVPIMAGSSLPGTWRRPPADVPRGAELREVVAITFHTTDAYGFHALEFVQALAEQRSGGESGVRAVQTTAGDAVWRAFDEKTIDVELFDAAWGRLSQPRVDRRELRDAVPQPRLFRIEYADGLVAHLLELNGAAGEWAAAWRYADAERIDSTLFWTQEGRPAMHFARQLEGVERMMLTGRSAWNVERTLLTSGMLDALLISLHDSQRRIETPYLDVSYTPAWRWAEPPPPPPTRPWSDP
jgi:hypothetical protein